MARRYNPWDIPTYNPRMSEEYNLGFAIGDALGNIWGANYNKRGIEKGEKEAMEALDKAAQQPVPDALYAQGQQANALSVDGIATDDISKAASQVGSNSITPSTLGSNTAAGQQNGPAQQQNIQPRDLKAEKLDYLVQKYGGATPNPDGDAITVDTLTNAAKGNLANMDFSQLPNRSLSYYQDLVRKELRANGRTDYQIEKVLENLSPSLEAKVKEGNDRVFGQLGNILNEQIKAGQLDDAQMTYARMADINPKMAKALEPKMQRAWNRYNAQDNIDQKAKIYMQNDSSLSEQQARNLAVYNSIYSPTELASMGLSMGKNGQIRSIGGGSGRGRSSSSSSSADRGEAFTGFSGSGDMKHSQQIGYQQKEIEKLLNKKEEQGLSWDEEKRLEAMQNNIKDIEVLEGISPLDADFVTRKVDSMINSGADDEQILAIAAQTFGMGTRPFNDVVQRLSDRRSAQHDNGYDLDTYRDEDVQNAIAAEVAAQKQQEADEQKKAQYKKDYTPGPFSRAVQALKNGNLSKYYFGE